jgi:hypothetical protein
MDSAGRTFGEAAGDAAIAEPEIAKQASSAPAAMAVEDA